MPIKGSSEGYVFFNKQRKKWNAQYKEYDVLVYNARTQTAIVSVDGFGYEFKNVTKDPGKSVRVKVSGRSKTSNYKLELA